MQELLEVLQPHRQVYSTKEVYLEFKLNQINLPSLLSHLKNFNLEVSVALGKASKETPVEHLQVFSTQAMDLSLTMVVGNQPVFLAVHPASEVLVHQHQCLVTTTIICKQGLMALLNNNLVKISM